MKRSKAIFISAFCALLFLGTFILPIPSGTIRQVQLVPLTEFGAFTGNPAGRTQAHVKKSENLARRLAKDAARKTARAAQISTIIHKVKSGDTIARILARFGIANDTALLAEKALQKAGVTHKLRIGEELSLIFSRSGELLRLNRNLGEGRAIELQADSTAGYNVRLVEPKIVEEERLISGSIKSSFARSAQAVRVPYSIIDELADVLGGKINFSKDLQPGDTFTVLYVERRTESGIILKPGVLKAAAISINGSMYAAVRHAAKDGQARYYDRDGSPLGSYFLKYPVNFTRVSSVFSDSRLHPVLKIRRPHHGVDFAAPQGTAVRAVADGIIERASYDGCSGNMIVIRHDHRYTTGYLHLSKFASGLRKGSRVKRGQYIGNVGTTGLSTGPHLHFSLFDRGRYIDPIKTTLPMITPKDAKIPQQYLAAMLDTLRSEHARVIVAANTQSGKQAS